MISWKEYFAKFNKVNFKFIFGIMLFFIGAVFAYLSISTVENFFTLAVSGKVEYYLLVYNALYLFAGALFLALSVIFIERKIDFTPIKDLKRQVLDKFTYLPIDCIESFNPDIETIEKELKNPKLITWHSENVLKAVLKADIDRIPRKEKEEASRLINEFANQFDNITISLYKKYITAYDMLKNKTKDDKILMLGLYNTLLECDPIYWPNVYNKIQEKIQKNDDLSKNYDLLKKQLNDMVELQDYKNLVNKVRKMKEEYKKRFDEITL
jgi:hypothetical protein